MLGFDRATHRGFHLHNSYTFWISRLASQMRESFNETLAEYEVSWPQWMILNVLGHELAETPAQIAEQVAVDRSAVTRLLDRLEAKALIARHHDGLDRRSIKIELTRSGRRLVDRLNELAEAHQARFLDQLHSTELRAFKSNIQKLLRAVDIETAQLWRHI